jgi:hypothetical protein
VEILFNQKTTQGRNRTKVAAVKDTRANHLQYLMSGAQKAAFYMLISLALIQRHGYDIS